MGSNLQLNNQIVEYINNYSLSLHPVQKKIIEYNEKLGDIKKMQISVSQCHFLHFIIKILNPKNILEIGTFTGLSTLTMGLAMSKESFIIALDKNDETSKVAKFFFEEANVGKKIEIMINNASISLDEIIKSNKSFDLTFIDADKENYINYFNQVSNKLSKNGIIISDNVLWSGKVLDSNKMDQETSTLVQFNKIINDDKRFKSIILPIRDGISISRLV